MTIREWKAQRQAIERWRQSEDDGPVFLLMNDGSFLDIRRDVPSTRAGCPTGFCGHVRCRYHLWRTDGDNRAGRPGLSSVPRDARGRTKAMVGNAEGDRPGTTLEPRWLEHPLPPSCALNAIDSYGKMSNKQTGDALGRHRTLIAIETKAALRKAVRRAKAMGMSEGDFVRVLMQMGENK